MQCCWARQTRFEKSGFYLVMVMMMFLCCIFLSVLPYYFPFIWHTHTQIHTQSGSRWQIKWKCIYSHFLAGQKETMQEASLKMCSSQVKKKKEEKTKKKRARIHSLPRRQKHHKLNNMYVIRKKKKDFTWKMYRKISMCYVGMY